VSQPANYVVAYEATERGREAVALGSALAHLTGAELRICLILPQPTTVPSRVPGYTADFETLLEEQGQEWLDQAQALVPAGITASTHLLWSESTSEGLIEAATKFESDRIVVGAARSGLLQRFSIGSVANGLLHASPVPVALAPRGYRAPERITRITCAIGTRPGWEALLDSMVAISEGLDVDVRFVTLVEVDAPKAGQSESDQHLLTVLDYFRQRASARGAHSTEVAAGRSIEDAVEDLDWRHDEIVFVGSSRLASPSRIFLGATANRMLRALPVPLIVVPNTPTRS
jgi:nucleotide-binding universal stress UspA family protein